MQAVDEGLIDSVDALLKAGTAVNEACSYGLTALHDAAVEGHAIIVRRLLEAGAEVNAVSVQGVTALMCAAAWGNPEAAKVFLEYGADGTMRDGQGWTAIDIAGEKRHDEMVEFLEAAGSGSMAGIASGSSGATADRRKAVSEFLVEESRIENDTPFLTGVVSAGTVRVGTVFTSLREQAGTESSEEPRPMIRLQVLQILAYGRQLEEMREGWSCGLVVEGDGAETLRRGMVLVSAEDR